MIIHLLFYVIFLMINNIKFDFIKCRIIDVISKLISNLIKFILIIGMIIFKSIQSFLRGNKIFIFLILSVCISSYMILIK